ncbi:MAG: hypothetical protein U0736_02855 [Gemmataceae bacterium]
MTARGRSLADLLALNRTVAVVLLAVLFFGLGEQLWEPFLSVYLEAASELKRQAVRAGEVSASVLVLVGVYALLRNVFEAGCYVGGGGLTARLGDRGSLLLFGGLSTVGYLLFLVAPGPAVAIAGALLILGWEPLAVPVTFTTVGSTVDRSRQGMAFAVQSIQKRLPKILGPLIAGWVLEWAGRHAASVEAGRVAGMGWLVVMALALGLVSLAMQAVWMPHRKPPPDDAGLRQVVAAFPREIRSLWLAETFVRWGDQLVREFIPLYLVIVRQVPVGWVGVLMAIQHTTALLTYLPVGRLTRTTGLKPFVGLTFVFFALFPLALVTLPDGWGLVVAFVIYGLREIGEPARKAMITNGIPEAVRARGVGLYWGVRSVLIAPAGLAGAGLWLAFGPERSFVAAFASAAVGAALFYALVGWTGRGPASASAA